METSKITSVNNTFIKKLYKLKENKKEQLRFGLFLVEGKNNIDKAIDSGNVEYLLITEEKVDTFKEGSYATIDVTDNVIAKVSSLKNHSNSIAVVRIPRFEEKKYNKVIFLENIQDPGNLGTIIRSSLAFSFDAIYVSTNSAYIYNQKVINATQGAIFDIPLFQTNLIKEIEKQDYEIYSTHLSEESINLKDFSKKENFGIAFGNEGKGVSDELLSACKGNIKIETNNVDSLNVSIAASIVMYELSSI